jgi:hypothetical protein
MRLPAALAALLLPVALSCSPAPPAAAPDSVRAAVSAAVSAAASAPVSAPASAPASVPAAVSAAAPASASASASASAPDPATLTGLDRILADARRVEPLVATAEARRFVARTAILPRVAPRALLHDEKKTRAFTEREAEVLPPEERGALKRFVADEEFYYNTRYGSPLSYARALDMLWARGLSLPRGAKILDFGYGYAGHLRMLAGMGFDVTGVDVDPMLRALYAEPGDQGEVRGPEGEVGRMRLIHGRFPADRAVIAAVGGGYDLILSKNVLKKGYIHPDRPAEEKHLIRLGASDAVVLRAFFGALKPGGWMLVYNICPAPSPPDKPFIPWSDGRSPFSKAQWQAAGFRVVAFDVDDAAAIRALGRALLWDQGEDAWDIENDLSVLYTLVQRP